MSAGPSPALLLLKAGVIIDSCADICLLVWCSYMCLRCALKSAKDCNIVGTLEGTGSRTIFTFSDRDSAASSCNMFLDAQSAAGLARPSR